MATRKLTILTLLAGLILSSISLASVSVKNLTAGTAFEKPYCAPLDVQIEVSFDISDYSGQEVELIVDWDRDNTTDAPEIITIGGGLGELQELSAGSFYTMITHQYLEAKDGSCFYNVSTNVKVGGIMSAASYSIQIFVWGQDNSNGGELVLDPKTEYVCVGDKDVWVTFTDYSDWNCVPEDISNVFLEQNTETRWTQWLYGTNNPSFKSEFYLDGKRWTKQVDGTIENHDKAGQIIIDPQFPNRDSRPIYIKEVLPEDLGKRFRVTLHNWNACNSYADGADPIKINGFIEVIDRPHPRIVPSALGKVCGNVASINLNDANKTYVENLAGSVSGYWHGEHVRNGRFYIAKDGLEIGSKHWVYYTAQNSADCEGTDSIQIEILDYPVFEYPDEDLAFCMGESTQLIPNVENKEGSGPSTYYSNWYNHKGFLDNTKSDKPVITAKSSGSFVLKYYATDKATGCYARKRYNVTVEDLSVAFDEDTIRTCVGSTLNLTPTVHREGNEVVNFEWIASKKALGMLVGDKTKAHIDFQASQTGQFQYALQASELRENGCSVIDTVVIIVSEQPEAIIDTKPQQIAGHKITLEANASPFARLWQSLSDDNGVVIADASACITDVAVAKEGIYNFSYQVSNNYCNSSDQVAIEFIDIPDPYAGNDASVCGTVYELQAVKSADISYWRKLSGPGEVFFTDANSTISEVKVTKPGRYAFLWVEKNLDQSGHVFISDSDAVEIRFIQRPQANFTLDTDLGCSPLTVHFSDASRYADSLSWQFDVKGQSSKADTAFTFVNFTHLEAEYDVQLTAYNKEMRDCSDTKNAVVKVNPIPNAILVTDYVASCSSVDEPVEIEFENKSTQATAYTWEFELNDNVIDTHSTTTVGIERRPFVNSSLTSEVQNRKVTLYAENSYGCGAADSLRVTLYPNHPITFSMNPKKLCNGDQLKLIAEPGARSYRWDFGDGRTLSTNRLINTIEYQNDSPDDTSYVVTLRTTSFFGCESFYADTVLVSGTIKGGFSATPVSGMHQLNTQVVDASQNEVAVTWDWGDGLRDSVPSDVNNLKHDYVNGSYWPKYFDLIQYAYNQQNCVDISYETIEVLPQFEVTFGSDTIGCSPLFIEFENNSIGATDFVWNFGDGSPEKGDMHTNYRFVNKATDGLPDTFMVTLIGKSYWNDGELVDTCTRQVVVYPTPDAQWQFENTITDTLAFVNISSGATEYQWRINDDVYTDSVPVSYKYYIDSERILETAFVTSLKARNSYEYNGKTLYCTDSLAEVVKLDPMLKADFEANLEGCAPFASKLKSTSKGALAYRWLIDGTTILGKSEHNFYFENKTDSIRMIPVTLIITGVAGKTDTVVKVATVKPTPRADMSFSGSVMSGEVLQIENSSTGTDTCRWEIDNKAFIRNDSLFNHTFLNSGSQSKTEFITLSAHNRFGCADTIQDRVEVYPCVTAAFTCSDSVGCTPLPVTFVEACTNARSYEWTVDQSVYRSKSFSMEFVNKADTPVVYEVQLVATSVYGHSDTTRKSITVYPDVVADFTVTESGMSPLNVVATCNSHNADSLSWLFCGQTEAGVPGSNFVSNLETDSKVSSVPMALTAVSNYGCQDTTIHYVTVYPQVIADFETPKGQCSPVLMPFVSKAQGAQSNLWFFENDSSFKKGDQVEHYFTNTSSQLHTFDVTLIAFSPYGFSDTITRAIDVYPSPVVDFRFVAEGTAPYQPEIINNTVNADRFIWDFGNGITKALDAGENNNVVTPPYNNDCNLDGERFTVELVGHNLHGCTDSLSKELTVYPTLKADFTCDTIQCSPFTVFFTDKSVHANKYQWDFNDGYWSDKSGDIEHTFVNNSDQDTLIYEVKLVTSMYSFNDTAVQKIYVLANPKVEMELEKAGNNPRTVTVSANIERTAYWEWDLGNGTKFEDSTHFTYAYYDTTITKPVAYDLAIYAETEAGCFMSDTNTITLFPRINAAFDSNITSGCSPLMVNFTNRSAGAESYVWAFESGKGSTDTHPAYQFVNNGDKPKMFVVELTATSEYGVSDRYSDTIVVYPKPIADVDIVVKDQCPPVRAEIINKSSGHYTSKWNFGSDSTSIFTSDTLYRVFNNYSNKQIYPVVTLMVSNAWCADTTQGTFTVNPSVKSIASPDTVACSPLNLQLQNSSLRATKFLWDFGDGKRSEAENPKHTFTNYTTQNIAYTVALISANSYDCTDTAFTTVNVKPQPLFTMELDKEEVNLPDSLVTAQANIVNHGIWDITWDLGDGTFEYDTVKVEKAYYDVRFYNLKLTVDNDTHCGDSITKSVFVNPVPPKAQFSCDKEGCAPFFANFTNRSYGHAYASWDFGDGASPMEIDSVNFTKKFEKPGVYIITLEVADEVSNSFSTATDTIVVHEGVHIDFGVKPRDITSFTQTLDVRTVSNANRFEWDFSDGVTASDKEPGGIRYHTEGIKVIRVIAEDSITGCAAMASDSVTVVDNYDFVIPNAFLPSKSSGTGGVYAPGEISVFYPIIDDKDIKTYLLQVFNRWGQLIFKSEQYSLGWDGYYNSELAPQDVYIYRVSVLYLDGTEVIKAGDVTLLR